MTNTLLTGTINKLELMFMKHYAPNICEPSIEVIIKMGVQLGEGGQGFGGGGQDGCERRSEVIVKIQKKIGGGGGSGQGGCERVGVSGWGGRVDVNVELEFF